MQKYITQVTSKGMLLRIDKVCFDGDAEESTITLVRKKSLVGIQLHKDEIEIITTQGKITSFPAPKTKSPKAVVIFSNDGENDKNYGPKKAHELISDLMQVFSNPGQAITKPSKKR